MMKQSIDPKIIPCHFSIDKGERNPVNILTEKECMVSMEHLKLFFTPLI